ncbi:hypothetical protein O6H91_17G081900 [Diphasiastrum complanatum]|uniref:Uncharacterized protein n=1 Tax=Diphasiastrum complanatum TaxID=34168 RepID=A0ACC2B9K5_DIPCM|nr:hypothetical protein O6H91_17G081900 [Diphasiastrum complanatum]
MDPRLRLQPGLVMQDHPSQVLARSGSVPGLSAYSLGLLQSQLGSERARQEYAQSRAQAQAQAQANANALRGAPGLVPSLSSGQGFYTVESLQGASVVPRQDGLGGGLSHLVSHDAARSLAGGSFGGAPQHGFGQQGFGAGQQGFDAASLSYLLAHQAASQKLAASGPSAGTAPASLLSHSLSEVNAGSGAARGAGNAASIYGYSTYSQPDVSLASARYAPRASLVPSEAALLLREQERLRERERDREKEKDRERERERDRARERKERERERERERDRERHRERARRDDWARERRRDVERRREKERRRELEKRRDLERKRDVEREGRAGDRSNHKSDTGSLSKRASRESPLTVRQSDRRDHVKSKDPRAREKKVRKAWCSLCQVDCTTQEMLERHLEGKKHKLQLEAEEQRKKESEKPENAKANEEENFTDAAKEGKTMTEEQVEHEAATGSSKGKEAKKGKAKAKGHTHSKKSKSNKHESKADASEIADKAALKETIEEPEKVKTEVVEQVKLDTEVIIDKVDVEVNELCSEGELKDVNVNPAPSNVDNFEEVKEVKSEVLKIDEVEKVKEITINSKLEGHNIESQLNEAIQEVDLEPNIVHTDDESKKVVGDIDMVKVEQEATIFVVLEEKQSGTETIDEVNNGTVEIKALPNEDIQSGIAAQSEGNDSILGKRSLEADGNPALAKKTRQLKSKSAGAAATVRCEVCKVTCRNATVYESHLNGEKHAQRLKKAQDQPPVSSTVKTTKLVEEAP